VDTGVSPACLQTNAAAVAAVALEWTLVTIGFTGPVATPSHRNPRMAMWLATCDHVWRLLALSHWSPLGQPDTLGGDHGRCARRVISHGRFASDARPGQPRRRAAATTRSTGVLVRLRMHWSDRNSGRFTIAFTSRLRLPSAPQTGARASSTAGVAVNP